MALKNKRCQIYVFVQNVTNGIGVTGLSNTADFASIKYRQDGVLSSDIKSNITWGQLGRGNYSFLARRSAMNYNTIQCISVLSNTAYQAYSPVIITQQGYLDTQVSTRSTASGVWDEVLNASLHNVPSSAGRRLRQVGQYSIIEGTLPSQSGVAINAVKLPSDASSVNGSYDPSMISITYGTGRGQSRNVYQYIGRTRMAYLDRDWKVQPDSTSQYQILSDSGRQQVNQGLVTSATTNKIILNVNASSADDNYKGQMIFIRSGTGQDQVRIVQSYTGSTRQATVTQAWATIPQSDSCYVMLPNHVHQLNEIRTQVDNSLTRYNGTGVAKQSSVLNGLSLTSTTDGMTIAYIYQLIAAMVNGKFTVSGNTITLYKRDSLTPLTTMTKSDTQRDRTS